jgi:hypothetical protein
MHRRLVKPKPNPDLSRPIGANRHRLPFQCEKIHQCGILPMTAFFKNYWPYVKFHLQWGPQITATIILFIFVYCLAIGSIFAFDWALDLNHGSISFQIMLFVFLIGLPLVSVMTNKATTTFFLEFVASKACSRYKFYFSRLALYYLIILLPLLAGFAFTLKIPDVKIAFEPKYNSYQDSLIIQKSFANSHVVKDLRTKHDILVVPNGNLYGMFWLFAASWSAAILLQGFSMISNKSQYLPLIPFLFILWSFTSNLIRVLFIPLCHWWWLVLASLLVAFVLAQWLTCWRLKNL